MTKFFQAAGFRHLGLALIMSALLLAGFAWLSAPRAFSAPAANDEATLLDGYRHVEVASVSDAIEKMSGQRMYLSHRMRPIFPAKFAGVALTVQLKKEKNQDPGALQGMLTAIDQGGPDSVYVMVVEDGDVTMVPKGYHPVAAVHGYDLYYLNVMAGPVRTWKFHNAAEHE